MFLSFLLREPTPDYLLPFTKWWGGGGLGTVKRKNLLLEEQIISFVSYSSLRRGTDIKMADFFLDRHQNGRILSLFFFFFFFFFFFLDRHQNGRIFFLKTSPFA